MNDPLQLIADACYLCFRFGLRASVGITGNLTNHGDGFYCIPVEEVTTYHTLEAALHCEDIGSGDRKVDVATRLGLSAQWVEGFIAGIAQAGEVSADRDYVQGYLAAEELRQNRPVLFRVQGDHGEV